MNQEVASPSQKIENDSSSSDNKSEEYVWVPWFCSLKGNEFFCAIEDDYILDGFNLTGLSSTVKYYSCALAMITDNEIPEDEETEDEDRTQELIENEAEILYGLIHARYILTPRGLQQMLIKYRQCIFGRCPRVMCHGQPLLPVGMTDTHNMDLVKVYCPRCDDIYTPRSSHHEDLDGAYFGTTFPHLFFLVYPEWRPQASKEKYVPKVFGYKLHSSSRQRALECKEEDIRRRKQHIIYR